MTAILDQLIEQVRHKTPRFTCTDIVVGSHWTMVEVDDGNGVRAGLSSTLADPTDHHHGGQYPVNNAGMLHTFPVVDLLNLSRSTQLAEVSIGFATLNALLDVDMRLCREVNAYDVILQRAREHNVAVIGHFPFVPRLKQIAREMWVLELNPGADDLPAQEAPHILPQADVVAITGTSLANGTFEGLLAQCSKDAFIVVLGATTPISPVLLDTGVSAIAGTMVVDPVLVKLAVSQGATFRQIKGKRLLTMMRDI